MLIHTTEPHTLLKVNCHIPLHSWSVALASRVQDDLLVIDRWPYKIPVEQVAKGSTVMLLFTVKKGNLPSGVTMALNMPAVKFGANLNMLGIAVLAEPSEPFSEVPPVGRRHQKMTCSW